MESEMTYSSSNQRAFEHASESQHHAANDASDEQQEAYEDFRDNRSDAGTLSAINDWLDLPCSATKFGDYRSAFETHDFGVWMASGAWDRLTSGPDDFDVRDAA